MEARDDAGPRVLIRWSPDGTRLRFSVISRQGHTRSLWEVSAEGHGMHAVPLGRREEDYDCCGDWSPDGRHFFFRSTVTTERTFGRFESGSAASAGEPVSPCG